MNALNLLTQEIVTLFLFHMATNLRIDTGFNLPDFNFLIQQLENLFDSVRYISVFEDFLLLIGRHLHLGSYEIRKMSRVGNVSDFCYCLIRQSLFGLMKKIEETMHDISAIRFFFHRIFMSFLYINSSSCEMSCVAFYIADTDTGYPFHQDTDNTARKLKHLFNLSYRAYGVKIFRLRHFHFRCLLHQHNQVTVVPCRATHSGHGFFAAYIKAGRNPRKDHHIPQGN